MFMSHNISFKLFRRRSPVETEFAKENDNAQRQMLERVEIYRG